MVEAVPNGELSFKERLARIEALQSGKLKPAAASTPTPVKVDKPAEERGEQLSMKDRQAALERIAAEKKKREAQAIADYKASQEETKSAPKKVSSNFVGKAYDYVPPAPKSTPSIPAPPKAAVKTFAIKTGECPWMMDLPGIKSGVQPVMTEEE